MNRKERETLLQLISCNNARSGCRFAIHDNECSRHHNWTDVWIKKFFMSVVILILLSPLLSYGVDLSSGIRHMKKHGAWVSFHVRDSIVGRFLASRASIIDETTGTTLNFTFFPSEQCQSDSVLIFRLDSPSSRKIEEEANVVVKIDSGSPQRIPANFLIEAGDKFAFYDISKNFKVSELSGHNLAIFSVENVGKTRFPLDGFEKAWQEALSICEGFMSEYMPINGEVI